MEFDDLPLIFCYAACEVDSGLLGKNPSWEYVRKVGEILQECRIDHDDLFEFYEGRARKGLSTPSPSFYVRLWKGLGLHLQKVSEFSHLAFRMNLLEKEISEIEIASPKRLENLRGALVKLSSQFMSGEDGYRALVA